MSPCVALIDQPILTAAIRDAQHTASTSEIDRHLPIGSLEQGDHVTTDNPRGGGSGRSKPVGIDLANDGMHVIILE